ncbi:MAG: type IV secretory system conjugative DNA transfer family protein, partial [Gammaproteobacteria bacterium]|nr:type IV secretory system conjugative DNA transfer family protein [Gammaproteobacteria bacterium]
VLPINPFYNIEPGQRPNVALDFTEALRHIYEDGWGERMDWILRYLNQAVLDAPAELAPSILSIPMMLQDTRYRRRIIKHIKNQRVRDFFEKTFETYSKNRRDDYVTPIQNKIDKILTNPFITNVLTPYKPTFQFKNAIKDKTILIVRLSTGELGTDPAGLLGSLTISTIIKAALAQAALPNHKRIPHFLFIDEQHNLKANALAKAYSETRKYKLAIITSTQYIDQLNGDLIASMFGNIGTTIAFRSSPTDARLLSEQFAKFNPDAFTELGTGEVLVRLLCHGRPTEPFRATTTLDTVPPYNNADTIRHLVRERYTLPRHQVERDYLHWAKKQTISDEQLRSEREYTANKRKTHWLKQPLPKPLIPEAERLRAQQSANQLTAEQVQEKLARMRRALDRHALTRKPTRRKRRRARRLLDV